MKIFLMEYKMLYNVTNHSSTGWNENQKKAAIDLAAEIHIQSGGEPFEDMKIIDSGFPNISPESNEITVKEVIENYLNNQKIKAGDVVLLQGEFSAFFFGTKYLKSRNIPVYVATTKRNVIEKDGKRTYMFNFVQFRNII